MVITKKAVGLVAGIVLLLGVLSYILHSNNQLLGILLTVKLSTLLYLVPLCFLTWLSITLQTFRAVRKLEVTISLARYYLLFLFSVLLNYLTTRAGLVFRIFYMKKKGLEYDQFATITLLRNAVFLAASALLLLLLSPAIASDLAGQLDTGTFALYSATAIFICILIFSLLYRRNKPLISRIWASFRLISTSADTQLFLLTGIAGQILFTATRIQLAATSLGMGVTWEQSIIAAVLSSILMLVSIVPGGLGIREVGTAGVLALLGHDFDTSFLCMFIDRAALLLAALLGGSYAARLLHSEYREVRDS